MPTPMSRTRRWLPRWSPARLLVLDVVFITAILATTAGVRAWDYLTGEDASARSSVPGKPSVLIGIEAAFPLMWWGLAIGVGVVLVSIGILTRSHLPVWIGHVILSALYTGLAVGLIGGYLDRPSFDGIRNGVGLLLPAALHALLWIRMGPQPVIRKEPTGDASGPA